MSKPIKAALFLRVSTDRQDVTRQQSDLSVEAAARGWEVVKVVSEVISGSADYEDRAGLDEILTLAQKGKIQKVMVHEVTRLGRLPSVIHTFVEALTKAKVSLYCHQQGFETLNPDGSQNIMADLMISILSGLAKNETAVLKLRILSGMRDAERRGVKIGRPAGRRSEEKTRQEYAKQLALLEANPHLSVNQQARLLELSPGTVMKLRKLRNPVPA